VVAVVSPVMFGGQGFIVLEKNVINAKPMSAASAVLVVKTIVLAAAEPITLLIQAVKILMTKIEILAEG